MCAELEITTPPPLSLKENSSTPQKRGVYIRVEPELLCEEGAQIMGAFARK